MNVILQDLNATVEHHTDGVSTDYHVRPHGSVDLFVVRVAEIAEKGLAHLPFAAAVTLLHDAVKRGVLAVEAADTFLRAALAKHGHPSPDLITVNDAMVTLDKVRASDPVEVITGSGIAPITSTAIGTTIDHGTAAATLLGLPIATVPSTGAPINIVMSDEMPLPNLGAGARVNIQTGVVRVPVEVRDPANAKADEFKTPEQVAATVATAEADVLNTSLPDAQADAQPKETDGQANPTPGGGAEATGPVPEQAPTEQPKA